MLEGLDKTIASYFDRRHCILVGSGTTALYVIFKSLGLPEGSRIIYPDITCETALNAAVYAGLLPVFSDIELNTFNLDPEKVLHFGGGAKAVVPTHIFGNIMDVRDLEKRLISYDMFVVEDAAQAFGGQLSGVKAGKMAEASIMSFGKGKIIDCGGGGAVLTDSDVLYEKCLEVLSSLNDDSSIRETLKSEFMKEMFSLTKRVKDKGKFIKRRDELKIKYRDAYLFKVEQEVLDNISRAFENPSAMLRERKEKSAILRERLKNNENTTLPALTGNPVYWRFSFLVRRHRDAICDELLKNKVNVSRLFNPLHFEYDMRNEFYPNSMALNDRIINVLLDFDLKDAFGIANKIASIINKYGK